MSSTPKRWTIVAAVGLAGVGLGAGATALAAPSPLSSSPAPPAAFGAGGRAAVTERPLFGVVHGDLRLVRSDGSALELSFDRGLIVSRTPASVTLARLDGRRVSFEVDSRTVVREGLRPSSPEDLRAGDRAMVLSRQSADGTLHAVVIRCVHGPAARS
jgi:hypothetical protein